MASLDSVSLAILLGAVLVMAGILSSLLALRFGAPLLLVFLLIGMLAGDAGPGQLRFDDVRTPYLVGAGGLAVGPCGGDHRRAAPRADHRAVRQICARPELDRVAFGRRGRRLDRCGGGISVGACAG